MSVRTERLMAQVEQLQNELEDALWLLNKMKNCDNCVHGVRKNGKGCYKTDKFSKVTLDRTEGGEFPCKEWELRK